MDLRRDLRRHSIGFCARGILAWCEQLEPKSAIFVRGSRSDHAVACVDQGDGSTDDSFSIWIDNTAADRPCGGILRSRISFQGEYED
jgi:hypothetical protein